MNPYEILGVSKKASQAEIKSAYKRAIARAHPDRNGGDTSRASEVNRAYDILTSPVRRLRYDRSAQTEIKPLEAIARDKLCVMFLSWLQAPDQFTFDDPIPTLKAKLSKELHESKQALSVGDATIARAEKRISKLKTKFPWLIERLEYELSQVKNRRGSVQESIEVLKIAQKLLKDISYSTDDPTKYYDPLTTEIL